MMLPEDDSAEGSTGGFGVTDQWIRLNEGDKISIKPLIIALVLGYYFYV